MLIHNGVIGDDTYEVHLENTRFARMLTRARRSIKRYSIRGPVYIKVKKVTNKLQQLGQPESVFHCSISEVEAIIRKNFFQLYDISAGEMYRGLPREESRVYQVDKPASPSDNEAEAIAKWKETGEGKFLLRYLLRDLCNRGVILPGKYLVQGV